MQLQQSDLDIMALCMIEEAGGEPTEGEAAIAKVIENRCALKFDSDGTVPDTIKAENQFSWTEWAMVRGRYTKVAFHGPSEDARISSLMSAAKSETEIWQKAMSLAKAVNSGTFHGPGFDQITPEVVYYYNPRTVARPSFASPDKFVCQIGHHSFFRA